ncbi:hypothetical protein C5E41_31930 [Nocardia nova]|nr:hypothetical protein C5E41_31930 [Nocardia nova]
MLRIGGNARGAHRGCIRPTRIGAGIYRRWRAIALCVTRRGWGRGIDLRFDSGRFDSERILRCAGGTHCGLAALGRRVIGGLLTVRHHP